MLGSNTDIDKQANNLIQQAKILGASDSEILQALTSKEGSNNDSRMIIGLLKLIASYTSSGGATDEQVASAVNKYLTDNPVQAYDDSEIKGEIGELKGDLGNLSITNIKGVKIVGGDYNEISKAKVVTSSEELLSSTENAILYGNTIAYSDLESSDGNAVLKLFVHEGDVIRQRISPYWSTATNGYYWIGFYNASGIKVGDTLRITRDYGTEIKENGHTIPSGIAYILINIRSIYYKIDDRGIEGVSTNGLTSDIITINKDSSLTEYDNTTGQASDYVITEAYYKVNDDLRIDRYESLLGDVDNILNSIVGGV